MTGQWEVFINITHNGQYYAVCRKNSEAFYGRGVYTTRLGNPRRYGSRAGAQRGADKLNKAVVIAQLAEARRIMDAQGIKHD